MRLCVLRGMNDGKICIPSVQQVPLGNPSHARASACLAVRTFNLYDDLSFPCLSACLVEQAQVE